MAFGQAIQGAAGGALGGGGYAGLPGALIGGGLGFLGGLFGGDPTSEYRKRLMQLEQEFANQNAPQAGAASQAQNSQFRGNQAALISQLEAISRGRGPSLATQQMQQSTQRLAGNQAALASGAAGRGVNSGAAFRQASNATSAIGSQAAADTGMMRTQEQLGALQQLGLNIHGARQQDESNAQFNAGQNNQVMLANLDAQLRAQGVSDQLRMQILMGAMAGAGPGVGTQLLAGGASMFPYLAGQNAAGQGGGQGGNPDWWHGAQQMWGMGPAPMPGPNDYGGANYFQNQQSPSGQGGPINPYA
jgi:hypothetical protein